MHISKISTVPVNPIAADSRRVSMRLTNSLSKAVAIHVQDLTNLSPPPFIYRTLATFTLQPGESIELDTLFLQGDRKNIYIDTAVEGQGAHGHTIQLPEDSSELLDVSLYPCWIHFRHGDEYVLFTSLTYNAFDAIEPYNTPTN